MKPRAGPRPWTIRLATWWRSSNDRRWLPVTCVGQGWRASLRLKAITAQLPITVEVGDYEGAELRDRDRSLGWPGVVASETSKVMPLEGQLTVSDVNVPAVEARWGPSSPLSLHFSMNELDMQSGGAEA
jgi:hypothetical protein